MTFDPKELNRAVRLTRDTLESWSAYHTNRFAVGLCHFIIQGKAKCANPESDQRDECGCGLPESWPTSLETLRDGGMQSGRWRAA